MHQGSDPKVNRDTKKGTTVLGGTTRGVCALLENVENQVSQIG
jgi:hypothetical protein